MPIYEYGCKDCRRKTTVLLRGFIEPESLTCEHCGGSNLVRLISRVALIKSEESFDDLDDISAWNMDQSDPRSIANLMRKMQQQEGEDLGPEFDEAIDRMEHGEMPEELANAADEGGWEE